MKTAIHWFRRDLRLHDNTALNAAAKAADGCVATVYILSEWQGQHHWVGPNRQEFLCECLRLLAADLEKAGGKLIVRCGKAEEELEKLLVETGAELIYCNRDPDPFGRGQEDAVRAMAEKRGAQFHPEKDVAMFERDEVLSGTGNTYRVYSPYFRAWSKQEMPPEGPSLRKLSAPPKIKSLPLPDLSHWKLTSEGARIIEAGEAAARKRLHTFLTPKGGIKDYATRRNVLGDDTSSRLSQDLRWGLLSIREVFHKSRELAAELPEDRRDHANKFVSEVAWRDFYMQILFHFPNVLDEDFNPATRGLPWVWERDEPEQFTRWCEGQTGFPIVDAAMRQLSGLGFMHNRLRIITAMFLTKDLRFHWREGEALFMRKLVDGEISNNNGNWQWSAGTGADAAPYFRIQNPWTQSERFDKDGEFIKEWCHELRDVPAERLHAAPAPGMRLAKNYPPPMVDHAEARDHTLEMFKKHRAQTPPVRE